MKKIFILFFCLSAAFSQAQVAFDEFGATFKKAVAKKDFNAVADMMVFPFFSFDWGYLAEEKSPEIQSRQDFLKLTPKIFDKKTLKTIQSEPFKLIEVEDEEPYYTLIFYRSETSAAWIKFFLVDSQWKAIGTDNVSQ
jgi:hypothetical protein